MIPTSSNIINFTNSVLASFILNPKLNLAYVHIVHFFHAVAPQEFVLHGLHLKNECVVNYAV